MLFTHSKHMLYTLWTLGNFTLYKLDHSKNNNSVGKNWKFN